MGVNYGPSNANSFSAGLRDAGRVQQGQLGSQTARCLFNIHIMYPSKPKPIVLYILKQVQEMQHAMNIHVSSIIHRLILTCSRLHTHT